ncbi:MAG: HEAT repeat domain-containing protein [Verrucomicrobia bacterium]|nr:HEAT repeat domain-containing protein [Verrucomicrobiota bacterium]
MNSQRLEEIADRITSEVFNLWWVHNSLDHFSPCLDRSLPALAQVNRKVQSRFVYSELQKLDDWRRLFTLPEDGLPLLECLAELLGSWRKEVQRATTKAISLLRSAGVSHAILVRLAELLREKSYKMQGAASRALRGLGSMAATPEILACLVDILRKGDWNYRWAAVDAIRAFGPAARTPQVLAALADILCDENLRYDAVRAILVVDGIAAIPEPLRWLAEIEKPRRPPPIARTSDDFAWLSRRLRDEDRTVRLAAADELAWIIDWGREPEILFQLAQLLCDTTSEVRSTASACFAVMMRLGLRFFQAEDDKWKERTVAELSA